MKDVTELLLIPRLTMVAMDVRCGPWQPLDSQTTALITLGDWIVIYPFNCYTVQLAYLCLS